MFIINSEYIQLIINLIITYVKYLRKITKLIKLTYVYNIYIQMD